MKKAIYAGSFNPFTTGHLSIKDNSDYIFGKGNTIVAIGINPAKVSLNDDYINEVNARTKYLEDKLGSEVINYSCFLHELILEKETNGDKIVLVRGLRNSADYEHEMNQLKFMEEIEPKFKVRANTIFGKIIFNKTLIKLFFKKCNVIFIRSDKKYNHVSSTAIRQLEAFRKGSGQKYII